MDDLYLSVWRFAYVVHGYVLWGHRPNEFTALMCEYPDVASAMHYLWDATQSDRSSTMIIDWPSRTARHADHWTMLPAVVAGVMDGTIPNPYAA